MTKPSLPQGMRDFSAETIRKRNHIFNTIKNVFENYGFEPLETPAMENLDTLMGKYGEEGDRLIFKVLNNGLNDPKNAEKAKDGFEKATQGKSSPLLTERALKYDLTIPFARFVAMNYGQLTFPYKRYQIQQVWRADRPQKGRYREFTQCDADVVGSSNLINEVELAGVYHSVFTKLGLGNYILKINSRKILSSLAEMCGSNELLTDITIAIDKLDKIGIEKVKAELEQRGLNSLQIGLIENYLNISGSNTEKLNKITELLDNTGASEGKSELAFVLNHCEKYNIEIDFTLARGLNYYTGIIFEVKAPLNVQMGSIGGGGRYDNLTELFGVPNVPGVGISFGVDRIYDVMEELKLFPENLQSGIQAIFFNMGEKESLFAYKIMQQVRDNGISCEMFHEFTKMEKQFKYADKKNINFAIIIGSKEIEEKNAVVKNLKTGVQENIGFGELVEYLK
ncbi:MAG: histidine--tRNA ligase [Bacteroidota bacterium]